MAKKFNLSLGRNKKHTPRTVKIIGDNTAFEVTEAYKAARTNLMFILGKNKKENNGNVFVITSSDQGDGKTTTCVNLALAVAQAGMRILVIDGDMRKPRIHKLFGIDATPGLSDKLSGMSEESCVYEISCGNLFVLPAGTIPPNPAELLNGEEMEELIASASKEFDYVIIDTPPIGIVTDAAVLCSKVAGSILVTRHNKTTRDELKVAADTLTNVGGRLLGVILNGVPNDIGYGYSRYGKYRGYYKSYAYKADSED